MNSELPVIMCTWKRPERFTATLEWLAEQQGASPHLYVFNNSWEHRPDLERLAGDSSVPVSLKHSRTNRGSIARFVWARELFHDHPYLVFIDDDQVLSPDALAGLSEEAAPRSITGVWAFRINSLESYWDREKAAPGEEADYVGTGGQILDASIFAEPDAYRVPPPYANVEDLWLCHQARLRGWTLRRSAKVRWTPPDDDDLDQWRVLREEKQALYRYLVEKGFRPLKFSGDGD
jgi:GT2 family glycosyltransferase